MFLVATLRIFQILSHISICSHCIKYVTAENMREYGFTVTRILSYKDKIYLRFCPYTEEYGSLKTGILAYFMQCQFETNLRKKVEGIFFRIIAK